ncbi:hypothetical protein FRACYDRAFT_263619 [Fragilariopsis cylindrus CCMP1102]|uniref:DUF4126 domain-containing protein n=1 Tax=Fragilariopsis cylindrus CCMP1102 TaxID=635003 RepID=A0A1E7EZ53_9STRA|nr:hypothetical protein FRACYDRAFT_263619 [Fragilariopsis cylindrus CCMP1102]|eukprot:OEU11106.1 hypothetical protein FRACYDRAFT_263619 [Fragilariopsis cylindrus CCMP1102]
MPFIFIFSATTQNPKFNDKSTTDLYRRNTGISPFLTLFVLGLVEMGNPSLLNMGETMEVMLASWWSIGILGILTVGETVGKCIPAIDEIIDSAEVFVVPVISVLASLATLGLLPVPGGSSNADAAGQGQSLDVLGMLGDSGGDFRLLQEDDTVVAAIVEDESNDFGEGFITFTKVVLVIVGIGLSLLIHFFKMILRVSSLMCSGGCCQPCITIMEFSLVIFGIVLSILAPAFAIVACIVLLIAAGWVIKVKFCKKKDDDDSTDGDSKNTKQAGVDNDDNTDGDIKNTKQAGVNNDVENQHTPAKTKRNTSITAAAPIETTAEFVDISSLPPPIAPHNHNEIAKPDLEATTY